MTVGTAVLQRTCWTWGVDVASERCEVPGSGFSIEVPAVVELLRLVEAGDVTATEVRQALEAHAARFAQRLEAFGLANVDEPPTG